MKVRFWGTRGSIPAPGAETIRYGGNTSCVEVRARDDELVVLDCGTGAFHLGRELEPRGPQRGHLLITHMHWDHIQGFPFFAPLFHGGSEWDIYAPGQRAGQLAETLAGVMAYEHSPVELHTLSSRIRFHDLTEGELEIGGLQIETRYLNHPALTLGYRIDADDSRLVYATDYEPHFLHRDGHQPGAAPVHHEDRRHVAFLEGADLVIHDSQYLLEEFPEKRGWGHTPAERAVDYALAAGAGRLALTHHDPGRNDTAIDAVSALAAQRVEQAGGNLQVSAAAEGDLIELRGGGAHARPDPRSPSAHLDPGQLPVEHPRVFVVEDDKVTAAFLCEALEREGIEAVSVRDGASALSLAGREPPDLILLDLVLPDIHGVELCKQLRASGDPHLRSVPIVVLTGTKPSESLVLATFRAGADDYLTKPVKPTLIRSRVRSWLLRAARR